MNLVNYLIHIGVVALMVWGACVALYVACGKADK